MIYRLPYEDGTKQFKEVIEKHVVDLGRIGKQTAKSGRDLYNVTGSLEDMITLMEDGDMRIMYKENCPTDQPVSAGELDNVVILSGSLREWILLVMTIKGAFYDKTFGVSSMLKDFMNILQLSSDELNSFKAIIAQTNKDIR